MNRLSIIQSPIESELNQFKVLFDASLASSNPLLNQVVTFIRQRDGKMMRPTLVILMAKLFNKVLHNSIFETTLYGAVALELLHTASLVHDDVVDESNLRRGQLSVNASFNNKIAVLSGDFILATCLVEAGKTKNREIIDILSNLGRDLSEGELLQLSNIHTAEFSEDVYFDVIKKKTAALFAACTKVGALSVHADQDDCDFAQQLGEYIGICFQIKDDIFDYYSDDKIGKPTGNDMIEGKLTLPALHVLLSTSEEWPKEVAIKIKNGLASLEEISKLVEFTKQNGGIEYAVNRMGEYKGKAVAMLSQLPDSEIKRSLQIFLEYVVTREK